MFKNKTFDMATFPRFSVLPNEIMLQIIETSDPEDLENLALCCKILYSLAGKTLAQHKADKDRWSDLFFSVARRFPDAELLETFFKLRDIVTNRRLQRYQKKVTIHDRFYLGHRVSPFVALDIQDEVVQACGIIMEDFESPYISKGEINAKYNNLINAEAEVPCNDLDNSATAKSLLLNFLPNVERISICYMAQLSTEMAGMIHIISKINRDAPPFMRNRLSLTKLNAIEVETCNWLSGQKVDTGVLEAFMTLPSLRELRLTSVGPNCTFNKWLDPSTRSNVTDIHCAHSCLSTTQLTLLLDHMGCLRIFNYDHADHPSHVFRGPLQKEVSPGAVLEVVLTYARTSLTYLNCSTGSRDTNTVGSVASFRGFEVLKTMRLSKVILLEDIEEKIPKKLVDELPASLEELEFVEEVTPEEAQSMFVGMLESKQERLPNLRYILFERAIPFDDGTILAYERAGLILDWRIKEKEDARCGKAYKTDQLWLGGVQCDFLRCPECEA